MAYRASRPVAAICLVAFLLASLATIPAMAQWRWSSPKPQGSNLNAAIWNGSVGAFVAVGAGGTVMTSTDGKTWQTRNAGVSTKLNALAGAGSLLVAVGDGGVILSSSDGATWTVRTSGTTQALYGLASDGSTFIAVGKGGTVVTSTDGTTWTSARSGTTATLWDVAVVGTSFFAVGDNGTILSTNNSGQSWKSVRQNVTGEALKGIAAASNAANIVVVGNNVLDGGALGYYSQNGGAAWTAIGSTNALLLNSVRWNGNQFVAVGWDETLDEPWFGAPRIVVSPDGKTWSDPPNQSSSPAALNAIAFNGKFAVAVGDSGLILAAADGVTWSDLRAGEFDTIRDGAWSGSKYVLVGDLNQDFMSNYNSANGVDWTQNTTSIPDWPFAVASSGLDYVAVGASGFVLRSADGNNWEEAVAADFNEPDLYDVVWTGSNYLAVGANGTIRTSPDGNPPWTDQVSPTLALLTSIAAGPNLVAVGESGVVISSSDGKNWLASANTGTQATLIGVTYGSGLYVTVGLTGTVLTSTNGASWTVRNSKVKETLRSVAWTGSRFVAVGDKGRIISSPDGITWSVETSGTDNNLLGVVSTGKQTLAFGAVGTILRDPGNIAPTVNAGGDQIVASGATTVLRGSTKDVDGSIASIAWSQVSGPQVKLTNANAAEAAVEAPIVSSESKVTLRLTATDNDGATSSDDVVVTIRAGANTAPTVTTSNAQQVSSGANVTLTANAQDSDGQIAGYAWSQFEGPAVTLANAQTASAQFVAPAVDTLTTLKFRVIVKDNLGAEASADATVFVEPINSPPSVNAGPDMKVAAGATVTLAGLATDNNGSIASYAWAQVDGPAVSLQAADQATANFVAPSVGTTQILTFELTVKDNAGAAANDQVVVTVDPTSPNPSPGTTGPNVSAGGDQKVVSGAAVTLVGTAVDGDGSIATVHWQQSAGPSVTLTSADSNTATFAAPTVSADTVLSFEFSAVDNDGITGKDVVDVTVSANTGPTPGPGTPADSGGGGGGSADIQLIVIATLLTVLRGVDMRRRRVQPIVARKH